MIINIIYIGNKHNKILEVKNILISKGYFIPNSTAVLDKCTYRAIKAFQNDFCIKSNDPINAVTISTLSKILNKMSSSEKCDLATDPKKSELCAKQSKTVVHSTKNGVELHNKPVLQQGTVGIHVAQLQEYLNGAGFLWIMQDEFFGDKTEEAVKKFQTQNNLLVDGIVGLKTWSALHAKIF